MGVDWGLAGQVGGAGFGTVFVLLIILAIVVWLMGRLFKRTGSDDNKGDDKQKGA